MITVIGISLLTLASLADGLLEGYLFDGRKSFERKFGVEPLSFFGSESWENKNTWYAKRFGAFDFYHVADDVRKYGYLAAGFLLARGFGGFDFAGGITIAAFVLVSIGAKRLGLWWIRK